VRVSFVIPVYNRTSNVLCVLKSLALQVLPEGEEPFEVIVADDGSTDGLHAVLPWSELDLKYYRHKHAGYRVSLMRNQGSRIARAGTDYFWYLDSDVLLPRGAYSAAMKLLSKHAGRVIAGRYDWLPPMNVTPDDVAHRWGDILACGIEKPKSDVEPVWGGVFSPVHPFNIDPRRSVDWSATKVYPCSGAMLSGNLLVPRQAWLDTGGFDEEIEAQGQDSEFGRHCGVLGYEMVFSGELGGYHLYHHRDILAMTLGVRDTIKYIHEKYNLPFDPEKNLPPIPNMA